MANLTLAIDDDLLHRARLRALAQGTSINAILRAYLEAYAGARKARSEAIHDILDLANSSESRRGNRKWTRDELHER